MNDLGSAFSPVAQHLRWKRFEFPNLTTYHFGHSLISIFGCLSITKFIGSSLSLTISSYSGEFIRLMLAEVSLCPKGFTPRRYQQRILW